MAEHPAEKLGDKTIISCSGDKNCLSVFANRKSWCYNEPMNTKIIKIQKDNIKQEDLKKAADILHSGGLVAFPTETVYGLGGDAFREDAAQRIYQAKGRPSDNPLIVHIADIKDLNKLADSIPDAGFKLAEAFWPGPLTMIFHKKKEVPLSTTGGLHTVAVRMPSHPVALALIRISGVCIAAPSANTSGRPSPTLASHVMDDLNGRVDLILDGGLAGIGIESTIIDLTETIPAILRPGYITEQMIKAVIGTVNIDKAILETPSQDLIPKAPGMKYKHYAPNCDLVIFEGPPASVAKRISETAKEAQAEGRSVGILASEETQHLYSDGIIKSIGSRESGLSISQGLYRTLREFDDLGVDIIYSESFTKGDFGPAIMNRLLKAAGYQVVTLSGCR